MTQGGSVRSSVIFALGLTIASSFSRSAAAAEIDGTSAINLGRMTPGYSYFNRPGAEISRHNSDIATCLGYLSNVSSVKDQFRDGFGGVLGSIIADAQADSSNRGVGSASLENCMVVHGWRVIGLPDAEGEILAKTPSNELSIIISHWVGEVIPHGTLKRSWNNDAAFYAVNHFSLHAQHTKNGHISLLAMPTVVKIAALDNTVKPLPKVKIIKLDPKWPEKAVKPETLDNVSPEAAVIIVKMAGYSTRTGNGFGIVRVGKDINTSALEADLGPDLIVPFLSAFSGGGSDGKTLAFVVPPGKWRIGVVINGLMSLNFCLGSPSFSVKAGEVIYTGNLDMKQEKLNPDMSLSNVKDWLGQTKAASKVKPASWINGSRGKCAGNSIYALEFDGFPFEPGYDLGSKSSERFR